MNRWLRGKVQEDADPEKQSYMQPIDLTSDLIVSAVDELEYLPVHYVHHFADSFAVLAYHTPETPTAKQALQLHKLIAVELFHFHPESREEFLRRHRDKI